MIMFSFRREIVQVYMQTLTPLLGLTVNLFPASHLSIERMVLPEVRTDGTHIGSSKKTNDVLLHQVAKEHRSLHARNAMSDCIRNVARLSIAAKCNVMYSGRTR